MVRLKVHRGAFHPDMTDFSDLPSGDQQAMGNTLLTLLMSFSDRDLRAMRRSAQ
jgi:hypothetical protein